MKLGLLLPAIAAYWTIALLVCRSFGRRSIDKAEHVAFHDPVMGDTILVVSKTVHLLPAALIAFAPPILAALIVFL